MADLWAKNGHFWAQCVSSRPAKTVRLSHLILGGKLAPYMGMMHDLIEFCKYSKWPTCDDFNKCMSESHFGSCLGKQDSQEADFKFQAYLFEYGGSDGPYINDLQGHLHSKWPTFGQKHDKTVIFECPMCIKSPSRDFLTYQFDTWYYVSTIYGDDA